MEFVSVKISCSNHSKLELFALRCSKEFLFLFVAFVSYHSAQSAVFLLFRFIQGGDGSNKGCFGRKTNFFLESGDFAGNRETWDEVGVQLTTCNPQRIDTRTVPVQGTYYQYT